MRHGCRVGVAIPALNEAHGICKVIAAIPAWVDCIVVADNGSSDDTAGVAEAAGAMVVREAQRGYGAACLAALKHLGHADIVVFVDGDFSDHPEDMAQIVDPIALGVADLVIGSRTSGIAEAGALTAQQRFGNWLATFLIRCFWGVSYTDLGPFRAIRRDALERIGMMDRDYGWTVEMQVKAARMELRTLEVPVKYRRRIGKSKISGTLVGSCRAGFKILAVIARTALQSGRRGRTEREQRVAGRDGEGSH